MWVYSYHGWFPCFQRIFFSEHVSSLQLFLKVVLYDSASVLSFGKDVKSLIDHWKKICVNCRRNRSRRNENIWTASSEFGTYRLCEQRRFRRACASAQSRQNLRCSLIQAVSQEEPSNRKPDPWPLWMAGHAQLKSVMTECSKTQIRLTVLIWKWE